MENPHQLRKGFHVGHHLLTYVLGILLAVSCGRVTAEALPRHGEFVGYLFRDRWGQDVFDYFYVAPNVTRQLKPSSNSWEPIRLNCSEIRQPMNPGGAMIHRIDEFTRLDSPGMKLTLELEDDTVSLKDRLVVQVTVENELDKPFKLTRGGLGLRITVAARGTPPDGERDEIFCCSRNQYGYGNMEHKRIRATVHENMSFTAEIPGGVSREFSHVVKTDLLANEYELQVLYRPREGAFPVPYILSPPVSLDVLGRSNSSSK